MFGWLKRYLYKEKASLCSRDVFDIHFSSPIGIKHRLDPNGDHLFISADNNFPFVEIGPISAEAQQDRLPNKGAKAVAEKFRKRKNNFKSLIAANIIKNNSTDLEQAARDYEYCFTTLYDYVDMFIVNVSENGAKQLQDIEMLSEILDRLLDLRLYFNEYKPILVQISDKLPQADLDDMIHYCRMSGIDGIATSSARHIRYIAEKTSRRFPILSKVEFSNAAEAKELLDAGATLLESVNPVTAAAVSRKLSKSK